MHTPNRLPSLIAFDWDNTLVDNWAAIVYGLNEAFKAYNKPLWTLEEAKIKAFRSMRDSFPEWFGPENWEQAREIFYNGFLSIHEKTLKVKPGAVELLEYLANSRVPSAVISNKTNRHLLKEVQILRWDKYFKAVVGAGDAIRDKPHPEPMQLVREKLKIPDDSHVWYIGDIENDIKFARAAGAFPIIINDDQNFDVLQFSNCFSLLDFLKKF